MTSTFFGLETARRGMTTQQGALYTTGHNISNANTPGYTRQRVNFEQTEPYPAPGLNAAKIPGQMGTGVQAGSIERIREGFLDLQYRGESTKLGYWDSRSEAMQKMEEIMNEPSDTGLSKTMDQFWQSLQDLAVNPTNAGARAVVRQRGQAVADTFNYLSNSLTAVRGDLKSEVDVTAKQIDSIGKQIDSLNKQISSVEPNGYLPNDLYDARDSLIDQLSSLVKIDVSYTGSGGNALPIAQGIATIKIIGSDNTPAGTLVDGPGRSSADVSVSYDSNGSLTGLNIGTNTVNFDKLDKEGKMKSLADSYGFVDSSGKTQGTYGEMIDSLDAMAFNFAQEFNKVHQAGYNLNSTKADFFAPMTDAKGAAASIKLSNEILASTDYIAASGTGTVGDGSNATKLANVKNGSFVIDGKTTTFQNFYESLIGGMAVDAQEADKMTQNSTTLRDAVDQRRQSVSAVSLDEEMTNMIQFQHAYNASARMITVQDELLDKIINGMGLVGR
ncbi:flagellar hook-associated protein FlgK [Metabacillus sp. GX 13764]|uniref:flagellar hook-associated protein FlgK n=1 Tax=Metabacillus kandeliae TaxID=2900151 RepID=UPI001E5242DC|nr:flagellar hook-associated protein FlgK [Metabacillus kandeliae]MCD7034449.1 flagellar hook-associated protein FlgK [Metabacillus kandeliae]